MLMVGKELNYISWVRDPVRGPDPGAVPAMSLGCDTIDIVYLW